MPADAWDIMRIVSAFPDTDELLGIQENDDGKRQIVRVPKPLVFPELATTPTLRVFTSSGTWERPDHCRKLLIVATGAGGAGILGGGAAGATAFKMLDVTAITSVSVTIGAAAFATAGGATSFGSHAVAPGGVTGATGLGSSTGAVGDLVITGGDGSPYAVENIGGLGGSSFWGGGGSGDQAGKAFGSGGGGGNGSPVTAGAGKGGVCVVLELY